MTGHCTSLTSFSLAPGGSGFLNMPTSCCAPVHFCPFKLKRTCYRNNCQQKNIQQNAPKRCKRFLRWFAETGFIFKKKRLKIYRTYIISLFLNTEPCSPQTPSLFRTNTPYPHLLPSLKNSKTRSFGLWRGEGKHHNNQVT